MKLIDKGIEGILEWRRSCLKFSVVYPCLCLPEFEVVSVDEVACFRKSN
jgi:hypothetical protein